MCDIPADFGTAPSPFHYLPEPPSSTFPTNPSSRTQSRTAFAPSCLPVFLSVRPTAHLMPRWVKTSKGSAGTHRGTHPKCRISAEFYAGDAPSAATLWLYRRWLPRGPPSWAAAPPTPTPTGAKRCCSRLGTRPRRLRSRCVHTASTPFC